MAEEGFAIAGDELDDYIAYDYVFEEDERFGRSDPSDPIVLTHPDTRALFEYLENTMPITGALAGPSIKKAIARAQLIKDSLTASYEDAYDTAYVSGPQWIDDDRKKLDVVVKEGATVQFVGYALEALVRNADIVDISVDEAAHAESALYVIDEIIPRLERLEEIQIYFSATGDRRGMRDYYAIIDEAEERIDELDARMMHRIEIAQKIKAMGECISERA